MADQTPPRACTSCGGGPPLLGVDERGKSPTKSSPATAWLCVRKCYGVVPTDRERSAAYRAEAVVLENAADELERVAARKAAEKRAEAARKRGLADISDRMAEHVERNGESANEGDA